MKSAAQIITFRTDASLNIGSGHVMRCITLADALSARGDSCHFLCRDLPGNMADTIRARGHNVILMPYDPGAGNTGQKTGHLPHSAWLGTSWQQDAEQTRAALDAFAPDWLIVDHYALDVDWEAAVLPGNTKLMVIDDLADRSHICDILLDQNLGRQATDYDGLIPDHCTRLIGPRYALLRPEFQQRREESLKRRQNPKLAHILISMGGVDKDNLATRVLEVLATCQLPDACRITVVMGATSPSLKLVEQTAEKMPVPTKVLVNVSNMAEIMASADLAIGAAGSTSWERCCLGLPTLMLVLADNQIEAAQALERAGAALLLGDVRDEYWMSRLAQVLPGLSISELALLSQNAAAIVDGEGIGRCFREMGTGSSK